MVGAGGIAPTDEPVRVRRVTEDDRTQQTERSEGWWARVESNHRPLACEANALPLSHAPDQTISLTRPSLGEQQADVFLTTIMVGLRHAVRALWRERFVTALIILTLGIGIGVVTALFAIVSAVL